MNHDSIKTIADWMKRTDLVEVSYRKGADKVRIGLEDSANIPQSAFPACTLVPVVSKDVGLFRWAAKGQAGGIEKGQAVAKDQLLGLVDTGSAEIQVRAPEGGRIITALADDGKPVEYGTPLFFIQPG